MNIFASEFVPSFGVPNPPTSNIPAKPIEPKVESWEDEMAVKGNGEVPKAPEPAVIVKPVEVPPPTVVAPPPPKPADPIPKDNPKEEAPKPSTVKIAPIPEITMDPNRKETVNLVFIGHVDAGKSTIGGHLLYLSGMVDKRTLEKYEREAKEKGRESWYLSWALDTNQEERDRGKTVECGRGAFETPNKRFTLLDAPGHKSFVPNMISGAAQADLAILVISARRGEFETGFEKGGQTREHAMLVKTAGTKHLIVLINKMDDPTVQWSAERYQECIDKLTPYLRKCGFNPKTDIHFMPASGLTGAWLKDPVPEDLCPWYRGPPLLTYLDQLPSFERSIKAPLRLPIAERFKDMGTYVLGKLESGAVTKGQSLVLMPNKQNVEVAQILADETEVESAFAGDNVKLKLRNVEEEDISVGFVICTPNSLCKVTDVFDCQIKIMEYKSIICAGYTAVLHIHCCMEEVTLVKILCTLDPKTNQKKQIYPRFIKQDDVAIVRFKANDGLMCLEEFKEYPQMGRFTLRDEGKTIAVGKVLKVLPVSNAGGEGSGATSSSSATAKQD